MFLLLLSFLIVQAALKSHAASICSSFVKQGDPTFCHLVQVYEDRITEYKKLSKAGRDNLESKVFPKREDFYEALIPYDGYLYPIPVGPTIYFLSFLVIIICWYFTACSTYGFEKVRTRLLLHPETAKFPNLPLYWLQQSKREIVLRREVRNTWAWLAKRYLLSPDDPLLQGIDEFMGLTTWEDFYVPKDTWSLLNVILKINQLYLKVKDVPGGSSTFTICKDKTGTVDPFDNVPKEMFSEKFHNEITPEIIEEDQPGALMVKKEPTVELSKILLSKDQLDPKRVTSENDETTVESIPIEENYPIKTEESPDSPKARTRKPRRVVKKRKKVPSKKAIPAPKAPVVQDTKVIEKSPVRKSQLKKPRKPKAKPQNLHLFEDDENLLEEYEPNYQPSGFQIPEKHDAANKIHDHPMPLTPPSPPPPVETDDPISKYFVEHPPTTPEPVQKVRHRRHHHHHHHHRSKKRLEKPVSSPYESHDVQTHEERPQSSYHQDPLVQNYLEEPPPTDEDPGATHLIVHSEDNGEMSVELVRPPGMGQSGDEEYQLIITQGDDGNLVFEIQDEPQQEERPTKSKKRRRRKHR